MVSRMRILAYVMAIAITVSSVVAFAMPAAAAKDVTYHLYVNAAEGWGLTNTSFSIPGPTLSVGWGDNVTLVLNATTGTNHRWYIDTNNDATRDPGEPQSPTFSAGAAAVSWNFTASENGTFLYRDRATPSLWGIITVGASSGGGSGTTPTAPVDTSGLIVVGLVAAVVAAAIGLAVGWFVGRRTRMPPPPAPPAP